MVVEYKRKESKLDQEYKDQLKALQSRKGMTKVKKDEVQQVMIKKFHADNKELQNGPFCDLFGYMKTHKLKLDMAYKHINEAIKKL